MQYQLRVSQSGRKTSQIVVEASSSEHATELAESKGMVVLAINRIGRFRIKFSLLQFCQELVVLLDSGLLLQESLLTLSEKEKKSEAKTVIDKLRNEVAEGKTFSTALANEPNIFPTLLVAMIQASEKTGNLSDGLSRFNAYMEQIDVLKKQLIAAAIYPAVILGFGFLVLLFLLGFVVPRFSQIYASRDTELSWASSMLMHAGQFIELHGITTAIVLIVFVIFTIYLFRQSCTKQFLAHLFSRLPFIGEQIRLYHLSRFYRTFATLLRSGIPVANALQMMNGLLGNRLKIPLEKARQQILNGETFSQAMSENKLVSPVAAQLFKVGERAGNLELMMERTAEFHEQELSRWVNTFTKLIEPLLMAILGLVIGLIVFLMYLPIFELASGI